MLWPVLPNFCSKSQQADEIGQDGSNIINSLRPYIKQLQRVQHNMAEHPVTETIDKKNERGEYETP